MRSTLGGINIKKGIMSVRLYAIIARNNQRAVVFRRGPSKQVLLLNWDLNYDIFEEGQWLKGRIYERRCDLSPDGNLLLYFAANYKGSIRSWSAISKPPYLTPLALWPKGDGWGGGGHFVSKNIISLNHRMKEMNLAPKFSLPSSFKVQPFGNHSGGGEDDPIWAERLIRDGWRLIQKGISNKYSSNSSIAWTYSQPIIWGKSHPAHSKLYDLQMTISGVNQRNGAWYVIDHCISNIKSKINIQIGRSDWADWDHSGDLLFSKDGSLFRLKFEKGVLLPIEEVRELIDLNERTFKEKLAPAKYRSW